MTTIAKAARPVLVWLAAGLAAVAASADSGGDPERGARYFRQCVACHSMVADRHLTGPSLADVIGRRAGTAAGFGRYSQALKESDIVWTEETLDRWLRDPTGLVPGTSMRIPGIADADVRRDLIAFLDRTGGSANSPDPSGGGMTGGMGGGRLVDLSNPPPNQQVAAIRYCDDAYHVTLGTGRTYTFWEFNLRFKTDSSGLGPVAGKPAILPSGMRGDRAFVIFADPGEISDFIRRAC